MRFAIGVFALAIFLLLLLVGCGSRMITRDPPEPTQREAATILPGLEYVWIDGYWGWEQGRTWQWTRGHWVILSYGDETNWEFAPLQRQSPADFSIGGASRFLHR